MSYSVCSTQMCVSWGHITGISPTRPARAPEAAERVGACIPAQAASG